MGWRPGRVLRLTAVLAMALADGERSAALTFVGLFRGLLIQTAYRSVAGGLMSQDRHAVLLWSHVGSQGPLPVKRRVLAFARSVLGTVVAVAFEFGIKVVSNVLLAAPLPVGRRDHVVGNAVLSRSAR